MLHSFPHICSRIRQLLEQQDSVLVAIDGNSTAGKTTLAGMLAEAFPCNVFHMDEFFLQQHQRTPERLAEAGGNVDYERFQQEVLLPLTQGKAVSYRPFDCQSRSLQPPVTVPRQKLTIVEGTYSCHPFFGKAYDLTIFLSAAPELQRKRVLLRPEFKHRMFFEVWIPMEQQYFDTFAIQDRCDIVCSAQEEVWD